MLFDNVNLYINTGESVAILGQNGSGKTTLLKIFCGILLPTSGELSLASNTSISATFPGGSGFFAECTAAQNLSAFTNINLNQVMQHPIVHKLNLNEFLSLKMKFTSTAQRQLVQLARAFILNANSVLLLDEPFAHLDQLRRENLVTAISYHLDCGGAVILTAQDIQQLPYSPNHVFTLSGRGLF